MKFLDQRARTLRAVGDPTRLRLLLALTGGELTVGEITEITGLSQPRVSRHLKLLSDAGLLSRTRDQNEIYYRATTEARPRALVRAALADVPDDDPVLGQDRERLLSILDRRQARAGSLLEAIGVRPLSEGVMADVGRAIDELLGRHLHDEPIGALLDVGTGTGSMLRLMGRRVSRAVGIDASREMRLVARASVLAQGLANCTVCNEDMYGLSFGSASFDIVTMDRVLGAAAQPGTAVAEASRVLRPGGHMLVIEPSDSRIDDARLDAWGRTAGLDPLEVCHVSGRAAWVSLSRRRAQIGTEAA